MSETDSSYVLELESMAQKLLRKPRSTAVATQPPERPAVVHDVPPAKEIAETIKEKLPTVRTPETMKEKLPTVRTPESTKTKLPTVRKARPKKVRSVSKSHFQPRSLQSALNQQARRNKSDLKVLMEKSVKSHDSKIGKVIAYYRNQNIALHKELNHLFENQNKEFRKGCEDLVARNSQEELERLTNWFHDAFIKELEKKVREYEELRMSSEKQAGKMTEEIGGRNARIKILEGKIEELTRKLPKDVRHKLFVELGLQRLEIEEAARKAEMKKRKGFFAGLASLFKSKPKASIKHHPSVKGKGINEQQKNVTNRTNTAADVIKK
jgi:ribosomal protein L34E